ncbi:MAG: hypothetical protein Q9164_003015 [Protoblastenia rupestris]
MSLVSLRFASTSVSNSTKRSASDLLERTFSAPPLTRKQLLDPNQLQRLSLTLNRSHLYTNTLVQGETRIIPTGTPVPPGYHLAYFTPAALPSELNPDGTDSLYSPSQPFTRRMWAGGQLQWEKDNPLRVGDEATETTKLVSAEPKITRTGEEMIVVRIEKTFDNSKGLALIDKRDWVFRAQLSTSLPGQTYPESKRSDIALPTAPDPSIKSRDFLQTPVSLFRFSALTFNGHQIHYSPPWCRMVEGHKDIVVHGPLNLINMLDFWRDEKDGGGYSIPQSIRYRATAPFYAGEMYRAFLEESDGKTTVKMWGSDGKGDMRVGMMGDLVD